MPENYFGPPLPYVGGLAPGEMKMPQSDLTPPVAVPYLDWSAMRPPPFLDFSGWWEGLLPQPGPVLRPKKGKPVPPPGNPPEKGGSQTSGIGSQVAEGIKNAVSMLAPSPAQRRDIAVYGLALIVFVIAVAAILR